MRTTCVVAGGGPTGMVLGLLLARAGVRVVVLEKHDDFLRDFRGDTVHASTLRLLDELGLGERFAALPQSRLQNLELPQPDGSRLTLSVRVSGPLSPVGWLMTRSLTKRYVETEGASMKAAAEGLA